MTLFTPDCPPDIYRGFERVLIAQNRTDNALEVAEQGRARALANLFVTRLSSELKFVAPAVSPNIDQIKEISKVQNSTLVQYSVLYDANQMYQFSRFKLSFDSSYAYAETLLIWVVQPTGEIIFRQVNLKRLWQQKNLFLASLVRSAREFLSVAELQQTSDEGDRSLQQLHQILIEPIADLLPNDPNSRITFIPQDFLFLVPFAALQDANGRYLIEKHTLLTAPSIKALDLTHQNGERMKKEGRQFGLLPSSGERSRTADVCLPSMSSAEPLPSLIVGNPAMPIIFLDVDELPVQLPTLLGAELEAQEIAHLLGSTVLMGTRATKEITMQQIGDARIIHLATHGLLDDIEGLVGALALAPSPQNDGFLRVPEIMNLKLSAELVVLSGCDISRGRIWGDAVVALSHAFIAAGVSSIIMSLWRNYSASNTLFMTKFYQNLQCKNDKAQALRKAAIATMQQHPAPKDWAAFTLIGEAESYLAF